MVTFDNMKSRDAPAPAYPWAFGLVDEAGYSHLGVMMNRRNDWFRQPDLDAYMKRLQGEGFFAGFRRVIFYGSSMGGYGALAFAPLAPGATVVAFVPQTSLDPRVVPFETRYRPGFARGQWAIGGFSDGANGARSAERIVVFADPWHPQDRAHVERLPQDTLVWAQCPWTGHDAARVMKHMGLLKPAVLAAWDGTLTEEGFRSAWRASRGSQKRVRSVLRQAVEKGHPDLVLDRLAHLRKSQPGWQFPLVRREAQAATRHRTFR